MSKNHKLQVATLYPRTDTWSIQIQQLQQAFGPNLHDDPFEAFFGPKLFGSGPQNFLAAPWRPIPSPIPPLSDTEVTIMRFIGFL